MEKTYKKRRFNPKIVTTGYIYPQPSEIVEKATVLMDNKY